MFLQFLYCCNIRNGALSSLNVLIAIDSKQSITAHFRSHCAPPTAPVCICFHISAGVCCENTSLPLRMFSAFVPVVYCCDGTNDIWSTDECENSISAGLELFARSLWGNSGPIVPEVSPSSMLFRDDARRRGLLKPVKRDWLLCTAVYRCVQHHTALCFQHYV